MGDNSSSKGCGFESQRWTDIFSHWFFVKMYCVFEKTENKKRGRVWPIFKKKLKEAKCNRLPCSASFASSSCPCTSCSGSRPWPPSDSGRSSRQAAPSSAHQVSDWHDSSFSAAATASRWGPFWPFRLCSSVVVVVDAVVVVAGCCDDQTRTFRNLGSML